MLFSLLILSVASAFLPRLFFREFLNFYELQPHHLPGNAIFYLSCYATFMEAYIGIHPTRETFARFFSLRINSVQGKEIPKPKPPVECGSCIIGSRQGSTFFKFSGLESCRAWQGTFFYVKNNGRANLIDLPPFQVGPPSRANWSYNPKTDHAETNRVAKDRFPLIEAERRGPCRKRALDSVDPDPYIFWKDLKMGKTPASRLGRSPPEPIGSSDDLTMLEIHERVPPLRAEAGSEFVDKLMAQGQKNKQPASMPVPGPSLQALPALRSSLAQGHRARRFRKDLNPSSLLKPGTIGCRTSASLSGHNKFGRAAPSSSDHRTEEDLSFFPENQDTGASNIGAEEEEGCRAGGAFGSSVLERRQLPRRNLPRRKVPTWVTRLALPFSTNHSHATARCSSKPSGPLLRRRQDLQAHQGEGDGLAPLPAASSPGAARLQGRRGYRHEGHRPSWPYY
ncbi:hypothetical protein QYE76_007429 [Lolium multiflorum]|uniref:Transposase (putative) gypsy type domain-containing protein n=1 Tax=Lolium multiflorum TaxID=4521 RepID=A0AAD8RXR6_LOLMU|nr:hypothetical protein QYE76_007429 [Lolium multiflorum]